MNFWAHVDRSGGPDKCWPWTRSTTTHGYGQVNFGLNNGRQMMFRAHRIAYEFVYGEIPRGSGFHGMCVLHSCDNKLCCNPNHLRLGTQRENLSEMVMRGRHARTGGPKGEFHPRATLLNQQVSDIKALIQSGAKSYRQIARLYKVSRYVIERIAHGETWRHIQAQNTKDLA